ncbi:MAG: hypothetical protein ACYDAE_19600 [Steroidobacteraceae bacterium]
MTGAVTHAVEFRITTIDQRQLAAQECIRLNSIGAKLEAMRKEITTPIDRAKQRVMDLFRPESERVTNAVAAIKRAMRVWDDEQERLRLEEQRRREEIARRERERLEREAAEARRKADEKAAAERQAAEAARIAGDLEAAAKHERKADQVEQRAETKVETLTELASTVVAPVVQAEIPKVGGMSGRVVWKFEVLDPNLVPREFLTVDEAKIRRYVGAMKGDSKIAGVRVYSELDYAASRRGVA